MELGFYDLFTSYEMELEAHVHIQIENQLGFHELKLNARTMVESMRWNHKGENHATSLEIE